LNAAGRMSHANIACNLLLTKDVKDIEELADKLITLSGERKERSKKTRK